MSFSAISTVSFLQTTSSTLNTQSTTDSTQKSVSGSTSEASPIPLKSLITRMVAGDVTAEQGYPD